MTPHFRYRSSAQRKPVGRLRQGLLWAVLISLASPGPLLSDATRLPQMGEPAESSLSPQQERELGRDLMRQIRAALPLLRDVEIDEYISSLGRRLATAADNLQGPDYTFFVLRDPTINAFAIPGGYIGINTGLWAAMEREEQLASVIAHEVAHITQHHHARSFDSGRSASLSTAAAVLAAIVIGQSSPEAAQAALAAGIAATQQSAINFTRSNEIEADRIGIDILATTQFDPAAMAEAFSILQQKNRLNTAGLTIEYLRTHPLDENRVAEAHDRAAVLPQQAESNQADFLMNKARLAVLSSDAHDQLRQGYLAAHQRQPSLENTYALAMLAIDSQRSDEGSQYLAGLEQQAPRHPMVLLLRARGLLAAGQKAAAIKLLEQARLSYPNRFSILAELADALTEQRRLGDARELLRRYLRDHENPNPLAWRMLGSVQQSLGESAASHESLARYFVALDDPQRARGQFELALREADPDSQEALRIKAGLNALSE